MLTQKKQKYNTPMELSCIQPFGIISQWTGLPAAATFSYGQPSICADLSDQLPYLSNF